MKIKVWEPTMKPEPEPLLLKLEETHKGVTVVAVDRSSGKPIHCGNIVTISKDGIKRHGMFNSEAGLPCDSAGRVELYNE